MSVRLSIKTRIEKGSVYHVKNRVRLCRVLYSTDEIFPKLKYLHKNLHNFYKVQKRFINKNALFNRIGKVHIFKALYVNNLNLRYLGK